MKKLLSGSFRRRLFAAFLTVSLVPLLLSSGMLLQIFRMRLADSAREQGEVNLSSVSHGLDWLWEGLTAFLLVLFGLFAGIFVGCLALAIAEMLDSIPIFARRISFRHGLGLAVLSVALGKLAGSLYYFFGKFFAS